MVLRLRSLVWGVLVQPALVLIVGCGQGAYDQQLDQRIQELRTVATTEGGAGKEKPKKPLSDWEAYNQAEAEKKAAEEAEILAAAEAQKKADAAADAEEAAKADAELQNQQPAAEGSSGAEPPAEPPAEDE